MSDEFKDIHDEDYPDNSNEKEDNTKKPTSNPRVPLMPIKNEPVSKALKPVTHAVKRQKNWVQKFSETFLGGDTEIVGKYIVWDVLIPATKDLIIDIVVGGIEMLVRGDRSHRSVSRGRSRDDRTYVEYSTISKNRDRDNRRSSSYLRYRFDDYIIRSRDEASSVIDKLQDQIDEYGSVSVYDLFDLLDERPTFTDKKWGWTNLGRAGIERVRDGYILDLPDPKEID